MRIVNEKKHFKMYKAGKRWLIGAIAVGSIATGVGFAGQRAFADDSGANQPVTVQTDNADNQPDRDVAGQQAEPTAGTTVSSQAGTQTPDELSAGEPASENGNETDQAAAEETSQQGATEQAPPKIDAVNSSLGQQTTQESPADSGATADDEPQPSPAPEPPEEPQNGGTATTISDQPLDPNSLTNVVAAKDQFSIPKNRDLQWTYQHENLKDRGNKAWLGEQFAAAIPDDAKGVDPQTNKLYVDEWMPDQAMQYLTYLTAPGLKDKYPTMRDFLLNVTKSDLQGMTQFSIDEATQNETANVGGQDLPDAPFQLMMMLQSLQGLQYATNVTDISFVPSGTLSEKYFPTTTANSNLYDISALADMPQLQKVMIIMASINDVSPLGHKPNLTSLVLAYNQIADMSPLTTDTNPALDLTQGFNHQHILLTPIELSDTTKSYITPSFIVKRVDSSNVPTQAFGATGGDTYADAYPSTAVGGTLAPTVLGWTDVMPDKPQLYGSFSSTWKDAGSDFGGWILQPYALVADVGNVTVNYALLQPNGSQISLKAGDVLAGKVGTSFDLQTNATVAQSLDNIISSRGYRFGNLALGGTGAYSDYQANNGNAPAVGLTGTFTDGQQSITLLFTAAWNLNLQYATRDPQTGATTVLKNSDGSDMNYTHTGSVGVPEQLAQFNQPIAGYTFDSIRTSGDGINWQNIPATASDLPYLNTTQYIQVLYTKAVTGTVPDTDPATLTVHYVDEAGTEIHPADVLNSAVGNGYDVTAPSIPGYVLVSTNAPTSATAVTGQQVTGQLAQSAEVLTYVYRLVDEGTTDPGTPIGPTTPVGPANPSNPTTPTTPVTPTQPEQPTEPSKPVTPAHPNLPDTGSEPATDQGNTNQSGQIRTRQTVQPVQTKATSRIVTEANQLKRSRRQQGALPQTGDGSPLSVLGLGLAMLGSLLGLSGWRKRRN